MSCSSTSRGARSRSRWATGLTIDEWLRYASPDSLALYNYNAPRRAKRLHFDVIPKTVDDYLAHLAKFAEQDETARLANPVWHVHGGDPPAERVPLSFAVLLNLASVVNAEEKSVLWGFVTRYAPAASPQANPLLDRLVDHALAYYRDVVKPAKRFRRASETEATAMADLAEVLAALPPGAAAEAIQHEVYEVGKRHGFTELRAWFRALYEVLLGQSQGPRMGSFIALYGVAETVALIQRALAGEDLARAAES